MANLEGMPIGSLPEATSIQDEDEVVVYRPSTGKAYQANTDLIDSLITTQTVTVSYTVSASTNTGLLTINVTPLDGYNILGVIGVNTGNGNVALIRAFWGGSSIRIDLYNRASYEISSTLTIYLLCIKK